MAYFRMLPLALLAIYIAGCSRTSETPFRNATSTQSTSANIEGEEKSFGERQLEQLLSDRPEMQNTLPQDHAVYHWVVSSFEKERIGSRIYWFADPPSTGEQAEHGPPYEGYPGFIRISAGSESSPLDKWTMLVFEMFNIENTENFALLLNLAREGKIDGDTYARQCVELEFKAAQKTRRFLLESPLPRPDKERDVFYHWLLSDDTDLANHERLWESNEAYLIDSNYRHFRAYFDRWIAPYVTSNDSDNP